MLELVNMMKGFGIFLAIMAMLLFGCLQMGVLSNTTVSEKYCAQDSDCACGTHIAAGECFVGNAQYVDTSKQCPDFCTGIDGNFRTGCVDNVCTNVHTTQIANPASVNCVNNGGTLEIVTATDGSQSGMCTLSNGMKCEEWAYYRGECGNASSTNATYSGLLEFTVNVSTVCQNDSMYKCPSGITGGEEHMDVQIRFSNQAVNTSTRTEGTFDYSCVTLGNYTRINGSLLSGSEAYNGTFDKSPEVELVSRNGTGATALFSPGTEINTCPGYCALSYGGYPAGIVDAVLSHALARPMDHSVGANGEDILSFGRSFVYSADQGITFEYSGTFTLKKD